MKELSKDRWDIIVVGGGQAGLSTGYYLKEKQADFLILDSYPEVGDSWKNRWDSLVLFTPTEFTSLPGYPFPGRPKTYPTKNEMAYYLKDYARKFSLPVLSNTTVKQITKESNGFVLETNNKTLYCRQVIVSTGSAYTPRIPEYSSQLNSNITQLHSFQYKNILSLPEGDVLVVGAGSSGVQLAIEAARFRKTYIAGKLTGKIPGIAFRLGRVYWWLIHNVLTINTPIGRKARGKILTSGAPLIRESKEDLVASGALQIPRVVGAKDGLPLLADGRTLTVSTIIWCTGFKPNFSWIKIPEFKSDANGWPVAPRGISSVAYLYFVGMHFQFGLTSSIIGGVGRDAKFVVEQALLKSAPNDKDAVLLSLSSVH